MISLFKGSLSKTLPAIRPINDSSSLEGNVQVATFDGEVKPSALILDKMKCNLSWDMLIDWGPQKTGGYEPLDIPFVVNKR